MPLSAIVLYRAITLGLQTTVTWAFVRLFVAGVRWREVFVITGVAMAVYWFAVAVCTWAQRVVTRRQDVTIRSR